MILRLAVDEIFERHDAGSCCQEFSEGSCISSMLMVIGTPGLLQSDSDNAPNKGSVLAVNSFDMILSMDKNKLKYICTLVPQHMLGGPGKGASNIKSPLSKMIWYKYSNKNRNIIYQIIK